MFGRIGGSLVDMARIFIVPINYLGVGHYRKFVRCGGAPRGFKINCETASSLRRGADRASGLIASMRWSAWPEVFFSVFARVGAYSSKASVTPCFEYLKTYELEPRHPIMHHMSQRYTYAPPQTRNKL